VTGFLGWDYTGDVLYSDPQIPETEKEGGPDGSSSRRAIGILLIFVGLSLLVLLPFVGSADDPRLIPLILVDGIGQGGADYNLYRYQPPIETWYDAPHSPIFQHG